MAVLGECQICSRLWLQHDVHIHLDEGFLHSSFGSFVDLCLHSWLNMTLIDFADVVALADASSIADQRSSL